MPNLMVYPRFKAWAEDGTPLASGKVYTYVTGTSTPATTYTDGAGGTANANPVVLDSNGEADIWGDPAVIYRIVVKTSADVVLQTIDHVSPITPSSTLLGDLNTNGYSITSSGANDITITPGGSGAVVLDGLSWPTADGTNGQVLKTDGAGALGWLTLTTEVVDDTTPQLGGNLDANSYSILMDNTSGILDENGNEQLIFNTTASAVNYIDITNTATGTGPLLKANGSDADINLRLAGKGTGAVVISGITYPIADGTSGQMLVTDGSGTLSFAAASSGTLVQREYSSIATVSTLTTQIPLDDTIPQNTEGDEITTVSITPTSATNRLKITAVIPFFSLSAAGTLVAALFQDSTADALSAVAMRGADTSTYGPVIVEWEMAAGTTSATTFKLRAGPSAAITAYTLANSSGTRRFGGVAKVVLYVDELVP